MAKADRSKPSRNYKIAGRHEDGVTILEPVTKPTHFTSREITSSVAKVRRSALTGRFVTKGGSKTPRDAKRK